MKTVKQAVLLLLLQLSSLEVCSVLLKHLYSSKVTFSSFLTKHKLNTLAYTGWWICLDLIIKHAVFNSSAISLFFHAFLHLAE